MQRIFQMTEDFFQSYQTAEWQRVKNKVLERDNYTCKICGESHGLMQVHHISYKRCNGKAYNAQLGDMITLCENCHNHDDGDHKHFFNGKVVLSCGFHGEKPSVSKYGEVPNSLCQWIGEEFQIISFRLENQQFRSVGFRTKRDWFDFLLGVGEQDYMWVQDEWHVVDNNVSEQRPAVRDEVARFVNSIIDCYIPNFVDCLYVEDGCVFVSPAGYKLLYDEMTDSSLSNRQKVLDYRIEVCKMRIAGANCERLPFLMEELQNLYTKKHKLAEELIQKSQATNGTK